VTAFHGAHHITHRSRFKPRKKLGQHFLVDEAALETIISAANLTPDDIIVEVGPGGGVLTKELARLSSRVIAVEIDDRLVRDLDRDLSSFGNVEIIHGDILNIPPQELLRETATQTYKVIANIPYYITSPILRHFLESKTRPSSMLVMVQKEVGEAISACNKNSLLSLRIQFYSKPSIVASVPAKSFSPVPKVDSLILRLDVYPEPPLGIPDVDSFFNLIACGFRSPRKQLRNSLAHSLELPHDMAVLLLQSAGLSPRRRAETLSLEEWKSLWETLSNQSWISHEIKC
jgi:16S rRNA (adenine1518-N6/adenine1519-N6)-dimethyltransferase